MDTLALDQIAGFTNRLYDAWPIGKPDESVHPPMNSLEVLSTDIPLAERIMYIALGTWFQQDHFMLQLQQARDHLERQIEAFIFTEDQRRSR